MFPSVRHRLVVVVSVVIGGLVWSLIADPLRSADGAAGLTLIDARTGAVVAVFLIVATGIPALAGGLVASATGTVLSGVFVVAAALGVLAASGGGMGYWLRGPSIELSSKFIALTVEMMLWGLGIGLVVMLFTRLRAVVGNWIMPGAEPGSDADAPPTTAGGHGQAVAAGGVAAFVAGIVAFLLIRSPNTGQVFCSLLLAFLIGGLAARMVVPGCRPWAIVLSPAVVGVVGYLWVVMAFGNDRDLFLAALFVVEQNMVALPGLALALPIHYASAGVVGATLGVGWARHFAATAHGK